MSIIHEAGKLVLSIKFESVRMPISLVLKVLRACEFETVILIRQIIIVCCSFRSCENWKTTTELFIVMTLVSRTKFVQSELSKLLR